jgi:4-amino-4-deoxy-L-arabinose transferase-like glycosyltransferase
VEQFRGNAAIAGRQVGAVLCLLTATGLALRIPSLGDGLTGDELSTAWIVSGNSIGHVLHLVRGPDELNPPIYFVFAWLSAHLGSAPWLLRLPSLLAGTATIPLVYLLGAWTVGRRAGLLAAALVAFSPFMLFYSTQARAYALMTMLVVASTLALLAAVRTGRSLWWAAYALSSCLALYTHYTAIFCLGCQAGWAFAVHPPARKRLIAANLVAAVAFAPWLPTFFADGRQPSTEFVSGLQHATLNYATGEIGSWSLGYPGTGLGAVPGGIALVLVGAGLTLAAVELFRGVARGVEREAPALKGGVALVALLAVATPVGELAYGLFGPNIFSARDIIASLPALAVLVAALLAAAGGLAMILASGAVLLGVLIGALTSRAARYDRADFPGAASFVEGQARAGDVVVDAAALTEVPLTPLDLFLDPSFPEYRLLLPSSVHPTARELSTGTYRARFTFNDEVAPPELLLRRAFRAAMGHRVFIVARTPAACPLSTADAYVSAIERHLGRPFGPSLPRLAADRSAAQAFCPGTSELGMHSRALYLGLPGTYLMPRGFHLTDVENFAGTTPLTVMVARSDPPIG